MKKVLFVEDNNALFHAYEEALSQKNISILHAVTGQEGLDIVDKEKPELIVLDIMLPGGISGFDVLEQLKANPLTSYIPVFVLTNLDSEAQVAKKIGAIDYKLKTDTSLDEIVAMVMKLLHVS